MLSYPVTLAPDTHGTILAEFTDFPQASAVGGDEDEAMRNAADALASALEFYFEQRRPVPVPSKARKEQRSIALPARESAKVLLWNEMHLQKLRKADLARRLNVHMPQIDRLFDLKHSSKLEFVEQAAKALGKTLDVSLV